MHSKFLAFFFAPLIAFAMIGAPTFAHAADLEKGKALFETLCSSCHGTEGLGDGPTGLALPEGMKPRNLQTGTLKYATDDDKFRELLHKGGAGVGLLPIMPAQPGASEDDITNIIAFVRSLRK